MRIRLNFAINISICLNLAFRWRYSPVYNLGVLQNDQAVCYLWTFDHFYHFNKWSDVSKRYRKQSNKRTSLHIETSWNGYTKKCCQAGRRWKEIKKQTSLAQIWQPKVSCELIDLFMFFFFFLLFVEENVKRLSAKNSILLWLNLYEVLAH